MPSIYEVIRQAIITKNQVIGMYDGYMREMCPHLLGLRESVAFALFYQFGGDDSEPLAQDGDPANWRCIAIEQLAHVTIREGEWHTAAIRAQDRECVGKIDVKVALQMDSDEQAS
jgi:hypothetical protein